MKKYNVHWITYTGKEYKLFAIEETTARALTDALADSTLVKYVNMDRYASAPQG